jgi:hypothetical protein
VKKKFIFIVFVALAIIVFEKSGAVLASGKIYDINLFNQNQNFNMPRNTSSYYFYIPKSASLDDNCYVNIHYSISNTLIGNHSSMTLSVNGAPVSTKWLMKIDKSTSWKVAIPLARLNVGSINEIKIETNHRSILGDCADIDNPANWVIIYKDSKVHLSDKNYHFPDLSNFYSCYFDEYGNNKLLSAEFVLPDVNNTDLVSNVLKISSSIGGLYPDRNTLNYSTVQGNINTKLNSNSIFIALYSSFNKSLEKLKPNQGFLSIYGTSANQPYYRTIISGKDNSGIDKASDFISNDKIIKQIKQNNLVVNSNLKQKYNKFSQNKKGLYKFSDFGYSDVNLAGAFHQKTSFIFSQIGGIKALPGSYINLKFKHSKILIPDKSLLTVYIDGKLAGNSKLSDSNSDNGSLKLRIPDSALKNSIIKVDIDVYNYIGKVDCSKDYSDSAWTYINSDSQVCFIPGKYGIQPSLENFPYVSKYGGQKPDGILMSFDKNIDSDKLNTAVLIAGRIGQNLGKVMDFSVTKETTNLPDDYKNRDMIFIGRFKDINFPDKLKKILPIYPDASGNSKVKNEINEVPETLKNKTVVQVVRSPWNFYKSVYVVMYDNKSNLKAFNTLLKDRGKLDNIGGQVSVIDNKLGFVNSSVPEEKTAEVPLTFASAVEYAESKTGFPWWTLLAAVVLIILCIVMVIRLRKKSNEFEDAAKKVKEAHELSEKEITDDKN